MATRALAPTLIGEKVILWAHNGHVQSERPAGLPEGAVTLGQRLRRELSKSYVVISGLFGSGSYRGRNPVDGSEGTLDVGNPTAGSLDCELWSRTTIPAALVNLKSPESILFDEQTTRWAGAALITSEEMITPVRPAIGSDAIAFVREVSPSESI